MYVVGSGIRETHEDFEKNQVLKLFNLWDPLPHTDQVNHETGVASLIGGKRYGALPGVKLVDVKVFGTSGSTATSNIILGVAAATEHMVKERDKGKKGPFVMNLSLGGGVFLPMDLAVRAAVREGMHVVAAAGNSW